MSVASRIRVEVDTGLAVAIRTEQNARLQLGFENLPPPSVRSAHREALCRSACVMKLKGFQTQLVG